MSSRFKSLVFVLLAVPTSVKASCGLASCPIETSSLGQTEKGMVRLSTVLEYVDQDQPRISRRRAAAGEIRGHHDEISTQSSIKKIGLEIGLADRFSVEAIVPFVHVEHRHIHNHHGTPIRDSWDIDGMGDLTLLSRTALYKGAGESRPVVSAIIGGIIPTGRDHVANENGDEAEVGIQPGKGAHSLIAGGSLAWRGKSKTLDGRYAELPLFVSSTYQWNETGNDHYKLGNQWQANAGTVLPLFPKLGFITQVNLRVARRDDRGSTGEEVKKTGGTFVFVSPGLQINWMDHLDTFFIIQVPVYQRVNVIQLTSEYNFIAGLSYKFSVL